MGREGREGKATLLIAFLFQFLNNNILFLNRLCRTPAVSEQMFPNVSSVPEPHPQIVSFSNVLSFINSAPVNCAQFRSHLKAGAVLSFPVGVHLSHGTHAPLQFPFIWQLARFNAGFQTKGEVHNTHKGSQTLRMNFVFKEDGGTGMRGNTVLCTPISKWREKLQGCLHSLSSIPVT